MRPQLSDSSFRVWSVRLHVSDILHIIIMSTDPGTVNGEEDEFGAFVALHAGALQSAGIPPIYWRSLHHKITNEVCLLVFNLQPAACPVTYCGAGTQCENDL